jgi:hypothetical protein
VSSRRGDVEPDVGLNRALRWLTEPRDTPGGRGASHDSNRSRAAAPAAPRHG